jgi:hypothetical protein
MQFAGLKLGRVDGGRQRFEGSVRLRITRGLDESGHHMSGADPTYDCFG